MLLLLFYGISENKAVKCDPLYENLVVNEKNHLSYSRKAENTKSVIEETSLYILNEPLVGRYLLFSQRTRKK